MWHLSPRAPEASGRLEDRLGLVTETYASPSTSRTESHAAAAAVQPGKPDVLIGLQYARGIAALTVAVTHAIVHPYLSAPNSSDGAAHLVARFGVTLFFIISGFIMVLTTGPGRFDPLVFMRRRLTRIAPLYYVATALVVVLLLLFPRVFKTTLWDPIHIVKSFLFIPAFDPGGSGSIHPTLRLGWTLQYEMFFYLAFACCWMLDVRRRAVALTVFFGGLVLLGLFVSPANAIARFAVQIDTVAFIAGVWMAVLMGGAQVPDLRTPRALAALAAAFASLAAIALLYPAIRDKPWTQLWLIGACVVMLWAMLACRNEPKGGPGRFLRAAGDASYSLYLFHMFAVGAVTAVAKKLPAPFMPPMIVVSAIAGIAIGFAAYRYVEQPLNRAFHRRQPGAKGSGAKS